MGSNIWKNSVFGGEFLTEKVVSPESLLKILEGDTSEIETIEFIPPRIGSDDFGRFKVKWEFPQIRFKNET